MRPTFPTESERPVVLEARDGVRLGGTVYDASDARGSLVIFGATAVPSSYYRHFARALASQGLRVLTFDYRGIGLSRPGDLSGYRATMTEWAELDARAAWHHLTQLDPFGARGIIGHSFGGQLVGLLDEAAGANAAVFVGAQFGYYRHWSGIPRARLATLWRVVLPALVRLHGYLPGYAGLGTDLPAGVAKEWASWCLHPEYLIGFRPDAGERYAAFSVPTLFYSATDDDYAPEPAVRELVRALPSDSLWRRSVSPSQFDDHAIGHFGFFRKRFATTLWQEAARFIDGSFSGAPAPPDDAYPAVPAVQSQACLTLSDIIADLQYGRA